MEDGHSCPSGLLRQSRTGKNALPPGKLCQAFSGWQTRLRPSDFARYKP